MSKVKCICANRHCKKEFMARKADRLRGWAKCCSKACAAYVRERQLDRNGYFLTNTERADRSLVFVNWADQAFEKHGVCK